MVLRIWKLCLATAIAAVFGTSAQAGLLPLSATVTPDGDNYRYTYGVMLTSNSVLNPGDSFVIYDFTGLIAGSNNQPEGFSFAGMNSGGNVGRTVPNDNPEMPNLVWTYTGDTPLIGQIGLGNFSALSTNPESEASTDFVSRTHVEDPDGEVREEDNITYTKAPVGTNVQPPPDDDDPPPVDTPSGVPEPSTMILLAAGLPLVAGARFLRGRRKA